jgi:hypothetical protein
MGRKVLWGLLGDILLCSRRRLLTLQSNVLPWSEIGHFPLGGITEPDRSFFEVVCTVSMYFPREQMLFQC